MSLTPDQGGMNEQERRIFDEIAENIDLTSAKDPHWNLRRRIRRYGMDIALGTAILAALGWVITDRLAEPHLPPDPTQVKLRAYKDARVLGALGVCDAELRAEASLEAYRASKGYGSKTGVTVAVLQNAASVARNYGISCEPPSGQRDPASYKMTSADGGDVVLYSDLLVSLSTANVCKFVADPLMPPPADHTDAEHYMQVMSDIAQRLKSETGQSC